MAYTENVSIAAGMLGVPKTYFENRRFAGSRRAKLVTKNRPFSYFPTMRKRISKAAKGLWVISNLTLTPL
jgi:hypothetical protein